MRAILFVATLLCAPAFAQSILPEGKAKPVIENNCVSCHSAGMILNQPAMPQASWQAEVAKMRNVYKAPVGDKDVPDIVGYLTAVKGPK